jgi:FlaA1/EpsC-like NDP-sugar epimerase
VGPEVGQQTGVGLAGSRGSFLPTLDWQVRHGLPVTITDPDVTRFFMTIPQAAGLVVEAARMADNGETYLLDMGEPVRIVDLVDRYAASIGQRTPDIIYTGLRPGEKMHEELVDSGERRRATDHPHIWCTVAREPLDPELPGQAELLAELADGRDEGLLRAALWSMLPDSVSSVETVGV